jgi:quercetin dioxygenase-like cupin family protein
VRIIEFGPEQGKAITRFDSNGLHATAVIRGDAVNVTVLHVAAGGEIGSHRATVDQLFMVVSGSGHVCGADESWQPITAGQAAMWQSGEHHTACAAEQMTAVVIEMESLPLARP